MSGWFDMYMQRKPDLAATGSDIVYRSCERVFKADV